MCPCPNLKVSIFPQPSHHSCEGVLLLSRDNACANQAAGEAATPCGALCVLSPLSGGPTVLRGPPIPISLFRLKGHCRRRGSQDRAREARRQHRAHSGNPAFRSPSINSFALDRPPRAMNSEIVKAGSVSSTRAAASRASASRPRWAKAEARQQ